MGPVTEEGGVGELLLGIDIGTYSSKGALCRPNGEVVADARVDHGMSVPQPGYAEHDADLVWWADFTALARLLCGKVPPGDRIAGVAASAIGPCLLPVDDQGRPLRPGILYGVDVRATTQIAGLEARYGREALFSLGGMRLTSQAIGPKILWLREHEPETYQRAARFHTASSYVVFRLTGEHVIDRHTASHFNPLIDLDRLAWDDRFADGIVSADQLPALRWSDEIAGHVTPAAAAATGIPIDTPVTAGAVDALAEAVSVGVVRPGDLMLMYGSTAFLILVTEAPRTHPDLWATAGAFPGQHALAAGMATTGSATTWFRDQLGRDLAADAGDGYGRLADEAATSPVGANGLLFLPYLSGERTPLHDPDARGVIAGLSLAHSRGDLYRALLEGTAFGIRHILETMRASGAAIERVVAVGGGATSRLWLEIVSNVAGISQLVPAQTVGASYGDAFLAGVATGVVDDVSALDRDWVRMTGRIDPTPATASAYDEFYALFGELYRGSAATVHALARRQRQQSVDAAGGRPATAGLARS
jgi:xylulokinase